MNVSFRVRSSFSSDIHSLRRHQRRDSWPSSTNGRTARVSCHANVFVAAQVGGHVRARVPRGFTPGDIFYKEYHPTYESNPEIRLKFRLVQPFAELQPTRGLRGERLPSGQYPLELMERVSSPKRPYGIGA